MKPTDWAQLPKVKQTEMAIELFKTVRGRYIMGQALAVAIETLSKEKFPEQSNIEDMEMIGEGLFGAWLEMAQQMRIQKKKEMPKRRHIRSNLIK